MVFVILAAFFNAVMDILQFRFDSSRLKSLPPKFWNPNVSYKYAKIIPFTGYKVDAWHLSKSAMIILLIAGVVTYSPFFGIFDIIILGTLWNITFSLSYKYLKG